MATASQLFTLENIVGGNGSPEMSMENNLSLRSKVPKETERTFPGVPEEGERGGSPQSYISGPFPSLGSQITWSHPDRRPHFVHRWQFCAPELSQNGHS